MRLDYALIMTNRLHDLCILTRSPLLLIAVILLLVGCAAPDWERDAEHPGDSPQAVDWPELDQPDDAVVYVIDQAASELRIVVLPDGRLARFGHPHVIGGAVLSGRIGLSESAADAWLDIEVDVNALEVDRPEWRIAEGFEPELEADAIRDTRANMLSPDVLDAEGFPTISLRAIGWNGPDWAAHVDVYIQLRDQIRRVRIPVHVERQGERIEASGVFVMRQTDFGITPFSALSGALSVADELTLRFRLIAFAQ